MVRGIIELRSISFDRRKKMPVVFLSHLILSYPSLPIGRYATFCQIKLAMLEVRGFPFRPNILIVDNFSQGIKVDLSFRTAFKLSVSDKTLWHFLSTLAINMHTD